MILAVAIEGLSQAEAARRYGLSEPTVSRWLARYRVEGDAAFEPRSRRPTTTPNALGDAVVDQIVNLRVSLAGQGLDAGPVTIRWHLQQSGIDVSVSTIRRRLVDAGLVKPNAKKRPKSSYIRFEAELPNETWQSDFTHHRLIDRSDVEIIVWLDDHSRYCLSLSAHRPVTGDAVVDTFLQPALNRAFLPQRLLTTDLSTQPVSPADEAEGTALRPPSPSSESCRRTPDRITPPPAAKSNASTRASNTGSPNKAKRRHSRNSNNSLSNSARSITTSGPTALLALAPLASSTTCSPKLGPAAMAPAPTTVSAMTALTQAERSPCAAPDACITSASAALTPEQK